MRTSFAQIFTASSIFAVALATPAYFASNEARTYAPVCTTGTPQCCAVDVLGVADLDCTNPTTLPTSAPDFQDICAAVGKNDMCCVLPILEQGILCSVPVGQ